ncbi:MAG: metallophosphoesterase family protein [Thermoanaerobaculia bacterium]
MRIAALYDIHGNLPALEAVMAEVREAGVDRVVVGGDVLPGPMPRETLAYLQDLELPVSFLRGNGDRAVLETLRGVASTALPEAVQGLVRWTVGELGAEHEQLLASWPPRLELEVTGLGTVLFCHATPRSDTEIFTRLTPEERLRPIFAGVAAPLVICGHTHMAFDRQVGVTRVVNAGSVGMPFGHRGASWLLLGPEVEPRRTAYDGELAAERVRATSYPQAAEFAATNILEPPSEEAMLERLGAAELQG